MRVRKEELAKQKETESQAAAAGPNLSELEKQKMEKMRQFIAQARDAKGIAAGQSAISSFSKPGMLSPLGGVAEGVHTSPRSPTPPPPLSHHPVQHDCAAFESSRSCLNRRRKEVARTSCSCSSTALTAPFAIDCQLYDFIFCKFTSCHLADAASISARSARIFSARFICSCFFKAKACA